MKIQININNTSLTTLFLLLSISLSLSLASFPSYLHASDEVDEGDDVSDESIHSEKLIEEQSGFDFKITPIINSLLAGNVHMATKMVRDGANSNQLAPLNKLDIKYSDKDKSSKRVLASGLKALAVKTAFILNIDPDKITSKDLKSIKYLTFTNKKTVFNIEESSDFNGTMKLDCKLAQIGALKIAPFTLWLKFISHVVKKIDSEIEENKKQEFGKELLDILKKVDDPELADSKLGTTLEHMEITRMEDSKDAFPKLTGKQTIYKFFRIKNDQTGGKSKTLVIMYQLGSIKINEYRIPFYPIVEKIFINYTKTDLIFGHIKKMRDYFKE
ncbi:MAG: hypothetical protein HQK49_19220 [Oligoflexia bacterium]|nr:hypothetical protein [Oligoflexia bacterium]